MDSETDHLVNEPPADKTAARESATIPDDINLALKKQRLIDAARAIDPLSPLRRHPLITVATAAAIGVVAASSAAARTVQLFQTSGLTSRLTRMAFAQLAALRAGRHADAAAANASPAPQSQ